MIDMVNVMLIENLIKTFNFQVFYCAIWILGSFIWIFKNKKKNVKYIFFGEINPENFAFMFIAKGFMNIV